MPPEERTFSSRDLWLLVLAAALLLLPNMIAREVRKGEALYSSVASDMVRTRALWVTTAHGAQQPFYPGYPWLVALGQELDLPPEIALRLPAVLCIATLAGLCGMVGYRRGGPVAGAVAAAVVICNPATLRCGTRAQSEPLLALLLCAAWMTWYSVGQRRKHWALAWAGAMLFVIPAAFTAGARAVAFFYLPFVFLRRPVKGRRRLLLPAHLVVLAATVAVIVFWLRRVPDQIFLPWNELNTMPKVTLSYPVEMILFPLKSLLYLMPWPFLFWPAFCMAYRPLESSPVVFHYLRTIVVSAFVAAWLIPKLSPLVLMPALGPIAIMTGLHAELLIRRHHLHLRRLNLAMLAVGIALAACGTAVAALHLTGIVRFDGIEPSLLGWNAVLLFAMLVAAVLALRGPLRSLPVHAHLIVAFTVLASSILALQAVWYSWAGSEQREAGLALAGKIPTPDFLVVKPAAAAEGSTAPVAGTAPATASTASPAPASAAATPPAAPLTYRPLAESIVYQQTGNYYLSACFYLGRPVVRVEDPKTQIPLPIPGPRQVLGDVAPEAPPSPPPGATSADATYRDAVYALCDSGAPVLPAVEWTALTPPIDLRRRKIVRAQWFPGGTTLLRLYTEAAPLPEKPKPAAEKSTLDTENPIPDGEKSRLDAGKPKPEEYQPETVRLYRGVRR
jgi:4-amino-4-deoxy-L-arabinose transferase-like glycosyltransferase